MFDREAECEFWGHSGLFFSFRRGFHQNSTRKITPFFGCLRDPAPIGITAGRRSGVDPLAHISSPESAPGDAEAHFQDGISNILTVGIKHPHAPHTSSLPLGLMTHPRYTSPSHPLSNYLDFNPNKPLTRPQSHTTIGLSP